MSYGSKEWLLNYLKEKKEENDEDEKAHKLK